MMLALLAVGLDPGIGMFHSDIDGWSSLALDAIAAGRPPRRLLARAVGDRDLNSFLLRIDPSGVEDGIEPGMTV